MTTNSNNTIFYVSIVLNITNGFGNIVFDKIKDTCIPYLINQGLNGHGEVTNFTHRWDSGLLTHDLYLNYTIKINTYRLIKSMISKWIAKLLKYTFTHKGIVASKLKSTIKTKFENELRENGFVVVLKSINVTY